MDGWTAALVEGGREGVEKRIITRFERESRDGRDPVTDTRRGCCLLARWLAGRGGEGKGNNKYTEYINGHD